MTQLSDGQLILRLVLSAVLSGIVGLEREMRGRSAGLRTHILVGLSSCLLMVLSIFVAQSFGEPHVFDPGRIAAGVVTGIGFLGAGTIIRFGESVKGLTTAASLWAVAALGLAIGVGFYAAAYATTALMLITLLVLSKVERNISATKGKGGAA
ncbi:MAG: MgtC/SapB family protein [Candidatus Omnitrophota bacterium]|nr:MgtC/SapB family protein [Candidatus Omnitrophota bacterium]